MDQEKIFPILNRICLIDICSSCLLIFMIISFSRNLSWCIQDELDTLTMSTPSLKVSGLAFMAMGFPTVSSQISQILVISVSMAGLYLLRAEFSMSLIWISLLFLFFLSKLNNPKVKDSFVKLIHSILFNWDIAKIYLNSPADRRDIYKNCRHWYGFQDMVH